MVWMGWSLGREDVKDDFFSFFDCYRRNNRALFINIGRVKVILENLCVYV